jgi:hypothetical protein
MLSEYSSRVVAEARMQLIEVSWCGGIGPKLKDFARFLRTGVWRNSEKCSRKQQKAEARQSV